MIICGIRCACLRIMKRKRLERNYVDNANNMNANPDNAPVPIIIGEIQND
jgi:hypothetical protein